MKRNALTATVILFITFIAYGQPRSDLLGTWKMDASRSKFLGVRGAPKNIVIRFDLSRGLLRETLTVVNSQGESTTTTEYALDGKEIINGSGAERIKSKAAWDKDAFILEWIDDGGTLSRTISLSADRRTMTVRVHDSNPEGETDDLIVLEKQ